MKPGGHVVKGKWEKSSERKERKGKEVEMDRGGKRRQNQLYHVSGGNEKEKENKKKISKNVTLKLDEDIKVRWIGCKSQNTSN